MTGTYGGNLYSRARPKIRYIQVHYNPSLLHRIFAKANPINCNENMKLSVNSDAKKTNATNVNAIFTRTTVRLTAN